MQILYFTGMAKASSGNFPNNLARVRDRAGLSQTEVAGKLGITQPGYSNLESGKSRLTVDRARKLTKILQCRLWELADDFLDEPALNPAPPQFRERRAASAGKPAKPPPDADPAMHDPVLRIVREYAAGLKRKLPADTLMIVYAAVSKLAAAYESAHHATAPEDYIRGVVAAKFESFARR